MSNASYLSYRANENIFRTLIEESPTPVSLYVGREMVVQLANKSMLQTWGKDASVIGKTYHEALPELEGQPIFKILDDVYTSGIAYEATEDRVDLIVDGRLQIFYFNFTFKPLKNTDGTVWGVINTAADVTELVLTRQKLAESEQRIQFAIDSAQIGTWDIDRIKGSIIWNDRCAELYGFLPGAVVTIHNVREHVHPDDAERITQSVVVAIDPKNGGDYDDIFRTIGVADNKLRWVKCKGKAYFNEDGVCYRFAGTTLDITNDINLREEQQKLIALVENSVDLINVANLDAEIIYLNKAGYELLGIDDPKDAIRPAKDYYTQKDAQKVHDIAIPSIMEKGRWAGELNYRHFKTGEIIPVYLNAFRIDDPATGKVIGRASVARDLRPEKEARNEQFKLLSLIDNSSDFVSLSDLDGNVSYVNTAGRKMVGINPANIYRHNSEYVMPDEMDRVKTEINSALATNGRWSGQINYRHFETGEAIPVFGTSMLVYDAVTGKPQGRASIARDLRREIADQKALADSEHLLKNITSASPTALWMSDDNGSITYTNQTWEDWTGQTFEETLGDGWTKCIIKEDRQRTGEQFISDLSARRHYVVEFRIKHKNGAIRWCVAAGNPQYNRDGSFAGYIGSCTDIDDQKQMERQKDDFLGIASHELKTPVTSIKAYAQVLGAMLTKEGETKKADMVLRMDAQVNRLTNLIGDLLDVTKINSGRLQFNKTWFDFNHAISESITDLQHTTNKHQLIEDFSDTGEIYSDKDRIGQVITNLITNAIKYSPHSGRNNYQH